jgi:hypothetical protein
MSTLPEPNQHPQARAVEIVADALRVLKTRDGIDIPEDLIDERARNAVTGLGADFDLVPRDGIHRLTGVLARLRARSARGLAVLPPAKGAR